MTLKVMQLFIPIQGLIQHIYEVLLFTVLCYNRPEGIVYENRERKCVKYLFVLCGIVALSFGNILI